MESNRSQKQGRWILSAGKFRPFILLLLFLKSPSSRYKNSSHQITKSAPSGFRLLQLMPSLLQLHSTILAIQTLQFELETFDGHLFQITSRC